MSNADISYDVAYAVRFKSADHRTQFMAAQSLAPLIDINKFHLVDDTIVLYQQEGVKWNESSEYVQAHRRLCDDAYEQGCAWEFCKVGKAVGDIEYATHTPDVLDGTNIPDILAPTQYIEDHGCAYPTEDDL